MFGTKHWLDNLSIDKKIVSKICGTNNPPKDGGIIGQGVFFSEPKSWVFLPFRSACRWEATNTDKVCRRSSSHHRVDIFTSIRGGWWRSEQLYERSWVCNLCVKGGPQCQRSSRTMIGSGENSISYVRSLTLPKERPFSGFESWTPGASLNIIHERKNQQNFKEKGK